LPRILLLLRRKNAGAIDSNRQQALRAPPRFDGRNAVVNFLSVIESKREGGELSAEAIESFIQAFTARKIPDYQMAAMLMAIYFRGLNTEETRALTLAMRDSGDVLKFPKDKRPLWTSIRPGVWATRFRCRWRHCWRALVFACQ